MSKISYSRKLSHPLFGARLSNFHKIIWQNQPFPISSWPILLAIFFSALFRSPFRWYESFYIKKKIKRLGPMPAPIFIIGHWRSGTTHLSNILSKDPSFGYVSPLHAGLPGEMLTLGAIFKRQFNKAIPRNRLIDKVPVKADSPQEDEFGIANMFNRSFLHGLYFPKYFKRNFKAGLFLDKLNSSLLREWKRTFSDFLYKIYIAQGKKRLVIRNPAYTARISLIKEVFPGAKFIHIVRDPLRTYYSMKNYYRKLFPALALQDYDHIDIDNHVLDIYENLMERFILESSALDKSDLVELKYEELEAQPLECLKRIYTKLEMGNFQEVSQKFDDYLSSISSYQKNQFDTDPQEDKQVRLRWKRFFNHWNYDTNKQMKPDES